MTAINDFSIEISPIFAANNKQSPYGGVTNPIAREMIVIIPKRTGSIPNCNEIGKITGTNKIIAGIASINVPINKKNKMIMIIKTHLLEMLLVKNSEAIVDN